MKVIGIIGAMEEEVISLRRRMELNEVHQHVGMDFYEGTIKNTKVIVVRCGIGKVNAAVCTQVLVDHFSPDYIINTGVAGGLHPDINVGDVVISSDTVEHDMDTTVFGDPKGVIPRMDKSFFEADEKLMEVAQKGAEKVLKDHKVWVGRVASGDQFIASMQVKQEIYSTFTAYCAEMEGAAIAHACYLNKIPFVIIRAISDKADNGAEVNFEEFVNLAARNASKMIEHIIENIE